MDGRLVLELLLEVKAEGFLGSSAETEDDVLRTALVEYAQQLRVVDGLAVEGCEIDVIFRDGDAVGLQPGEVALRGCGCGHDPEARAGLVELGLLKEHAKILEAGELGDAVVLDEVPPVIIPVGIRDGANLSKAVKIVFIIKDNMDSFKNFRAELDGKWLLFSNDKGKSFAYKLDEHCPAGNHVHAGESVEEDQDVDIETVHPPDLCLMSVSLTRTRQTCEWSFRL